MKLAHWNVYLTVELKVTIVLALSSRIRLEHDVQTVQKRYQVLNHHQLESVDYKKRKCTWLCKYLP